jgi:hypothetical protein
VQPLTDPTGLLSNLPEPLLKMNRFLLWREVPDPKSDDPHHVKKVPFYAHSGRQRKGLLDTEADLAQLVSLDDAIDEFLVGNYSGIGYALTAHDKIGAFDLDKCLTPAGHLIQDHPGHALVLEAKHLGCYIEISPSGRGLRIVGPCENIEAFSKGGLEYWGAKRYVTLTGQVWANPNGWVSLEGLRSGLGARRKPKDDEVDEDLGIITPRTIDELQDALEAFPSDERELWIRMGLALKTVGKKGKALWLEWSKRSKKFNAADAERVWESFEPSDTNYKAVFAEAQRNGWKNPRSKPRLAADNDDPEDPEEEQAAPEFEAIDLGDEKLHYTEFVLDGFIPAGVSVIAGAWGAGKSTNLIPLLASVAHIAPEGWGFWPDLRRHVLWVTEAPEQARDTLYSLAKEEEAAPWGEFKEWFHIYPARRKAPKRIARQVKALVDRFSYVTDTGFRVHPVVILDTTTANLDLENESDNSEVGAAMSILKQALPGVPLILIGHTPKAVVKGDIGDMTFRGAGAWEAEAVATFFVVYDPEIEARFLGIRKARFTPAFREIDFDSRSGSELVETPWGEPQSKPYMHGVPTKSNGEARKQAKAEAKAERKDMLKETAKTERQEAIMAAVREHVADGKPITKTDLRKIIGGKSELLSGALDRLVEDGELDLHPVMGEQVGRNMGRPVEIILPADVSLQLFLDKVKK